MENELRNESADFKFIFIEWMNEHLKTFLEEAPAVLEMNVPEYELCDQSFTLRELIELLIFISDELINMSDIENEYTKKVNLFLDIWIIVFPEMCY